MSLASEPIIVVGPFRSGTSAVAATLVHLGLFMGEDQALFPPDRFNPDGHWELLEMMALNDRLIKAYRTDHYPARWLPENWSEAPFCLNAIRDIRTLLVKNFGGATQWGWKEPATTILLPLYRRALAEEGTAARYLIVVRHPKSVLKSMMKRFVEVPLETFDNRPEVLEGIKERLMSMVLSYTLSSLKETQGAKRQLLIYERFLSNPEHYVDRAASTLVPWTPNEAQIRTAKDSVKPHLSHSPFSPDEPLHEWPGLLGRTYDLCNRADLDPQLFESRGFDSEIDDLWGEWLSTRRMIQPLTMPVSSFSLSWADSSGPVESSENYLPIGVSQTLRRTIEAPSGTTIAIDLYHLPCQIWIKHAKWHWDGETSAAKLKAGPGGTIDLLAGQTRLSAFGPEALLVETPAEPGPFELVVEFQLRADTVALSSVAAILARKAVEPAR